MIGILCAMNPNPSAITILCYGDSNTWGKVPGTTPAQRYPVDVRWTGILQAKLGSSYEVLEEGLNSRITDLDDPDPQKPGRNGLTLLPPTLEANHPFDLIIFMLGTNDIKKQYNREAEGVAEGMRKLLLEVDVYAKKFGIQRPPILLISPPLVQEVRKEMYEGGEEKSRKLGALYKNLAIECSSEDSPCYFMDAAACGSPSSVDGVHLDQDTHQKLAEMIFDQIRLMKVC